MSHITSGTLIASHTKVRLDGVWDQRGDEGAEVDFSNSLKRLVWSDEEEDAACVDLVGDVVLAGVEVRVVRLRGDSCIVAEDGSGKSEG